MGNPRTSARVEVPPLKRLARSASHREAWEPQLSIVAAFLPSKVSKKPTTSPSWRIVPAGGVTVIPNNDSYSLVTLIPATALSSMRAPMVERNS